jgi:cytochrome c peroxidase
MRTKVGVVILFLATISTSFYFLSKNELEPVIIETPFGFPKMPTNLNNPLTKEGVALGKYLFYDSILSIDYSVNCASCHKQENAFSDPAKFSKGVQGVDLKRNTLPLFNLAWYSGMFWDRKTMSIEEQVIFPVASHEEMGLNWSEAIKRIKESSFYMNQFSNVFKTKNIDSTHVAKAIAQFERTLISSSSKFDMSIVGKAKLTKDEYKGYDIINDRNFGDCLNCHSTDANVLSTNGSYANNGLDDVKSLDDYKDIGLGGMTQVKKDNGKFKVPSLRNLGFTAPYMHDGRFSTLEEVVAFYANDVNHSAKYDNKMTHYTNGRKRLDSVEQANVVAYLHTLNDSVFVKNPAFSNPFRKKD